MRRRPGGEPSAGEREGAPFAGREPSAGEREGAPLASKDSAVERNGAPLAEKIPGARMRRFYLLVSLIACHAGGALAAEPVDAAQSANAAQVQARLNALTEELNSLDTWLSQAEQRRARLLQELRTRDRAVAEAGAAVASSDAALAEIHGELTRLDGERSELEAQQIRESGHVGDHLAAAYRLRGHDMLKLLLDQQSPATLERMLVYHRYLIESRLDSLQSYRQASAQFERVAEALAYRQAAEREERQRLVARRRELEWNRQQREALIETLDKDVEDKAGRRQALLRNQGRLRTLFAELQRQSSDLPGAAFAERKGALPWPLEGKLVSRFGQSRASGRMQWQGVMLRAEPGSPVRAVFRGRVVFADWLRGFGLLTILDHGDGYMTLYGHADRLAKRPGDMVESGEVIAHAGQSGGNQASGLYFEIRRNGNAADPLKWIVRGG